MSRRFEDPSLQGIRTLEVWAGKDEDRRFEIKWRGPRRGRDGGYRVLVWSVDANGIAGSGRNEVFDGVTLQDAALEATKGEE